MPQEPSPLPPSLRDRLRILRPLGQGSFGKVFEVQTPEGEVRALKLIPVQGDGRRELREIQAAQALEHPHILRCFSAGLEEGVAWMLLELAESSLEAQLEGPVPRAWDTLLQGAQGVLALHHAGLIHRDLKPANLLVAGGQGVIADFGLAKGKDLKTLTQEGWILGTPQFMAPEQARGDPLGPPTDLFALGAIAYRILEGRGIYPDLPLPELFPVLTQGRTYPLDRARSWLEPRALRALEASLAPDPRARGELGPWIEALQAGLLDPGSKRCPRSQPTQIRALSPSPDAVLADSTLSREPAKSGSDSRRPRGGLWLGGLLLAFLGFQLSRTEPTRPPEEIPSAQGIDSPSSQTLLSPVEAQQLRAKLKDSWDWVWEGGVVRREAPPDAKKALPNFAQLDPVWYEQQLGAFPEIQRLQGWFTKGGEWHQLSPLDQDLLDQVDQSFHERDLFPPFQVWKDLRAPGTPWLQAHQPYSDEAERLLFEFNAEAKARVQGQSVRSLGPMPFPLSTLVQLDIGGRLRGLASSGVFLGSLDNEVRHFRKFFSRCLVWTRPGSLATYRALICLARHAREHPELSPEFQRHLLRLDSNRIAFWLSPLAVHDPSFWLGGPPEGAAATMLAGHLSFRISETQKDLDLPIRMDLVRRGVAHFERFLAHPEWSNQLELKTLSAFGFNYFGHLRTLGFPALLEGYRRFHKKFERLPGAGLGLTGRSLMDGYRLSDETDPPPEVEAAYQALSRTKIPDWEGDSEWRNLEQAIRKYREHREEQRTQARVRSP